MLDDMKFEKVKFKMYKDKMNMFRILRTSYISEFLEKVILSNIFGDVKCFLVYIVTAKIMNENITH